MTIILDRYALPEKGVVDLKIERSFEIKITASDARDKVRWWLRDEVSMHLDADPPTLVVGEQIVWRVPAVLSVMGTGRVGIVGFVEVEVATGTMTNTPEHQAIIEKRAKQMVAQLPPHPPKGPVRDQYRPRHIPAAPQVSFDANDLPIVMFAQSSDAD